MKLQAKIAIVTGGSRGIGAATAQLFAENGAKVFIWDVLEEGKQTAEKINESIGKENVHFAKVNITDNENIASALQEVIEKYGRIDILINNAGITRDKSFMKMSHYEWQQVIDVNLTGVFNCTKAVAPYMKAQQYGRIVSASSVVGIYGNFGQTNYVAAKAGVIGMTKVWAKELGKYGITSNAIAPGFVETDMTKKMPEAAIKHAVSNIAVRRIGQPIDIANGYLFLASEDASFINGICLSIDGGV